MNAGSESYPCDDDVDSSVSSVALSCCCNSSWCMKMNIDRPALVPTGTGRTATSLCSTVAGRGGGGFFGRPCFMQLWAPSCPNARLQGRAHQWFHVGSLLHCSKHLRVGRIFGRFVRRRRATACLSRRLVLGTTSAVPITVPSVLSGSLSCSAETDDDAVLDEASAPHASRCLLRPPLASPAPSALPSPCAWT